MKKTINFLLVIGLFLSFTVNASMVCPSTLTCDYEKGVCNTPAGWTLHSEGAQEYFSGSQNVELSKLNALKYPSNVPENDLYSLWCWYFYENNSSYFILTTNVKTLTGTNWVFSGFGKSHAECSDIKDPITCAGEQ